MTTKKQQHWLMELINYLGLTIGGFATEIGTSQAAINNIIEGKYNLSFKVADKIMKRYPVKKSWLILGEGEMWDKDYFRDRYEKYGEYHTDFPNKIENLQKIFDCNKSILANKLGLSRSHVSALSLNKIQSLSPDTIDAITRHVKYIPREFWE